MTKTNERFYYNENSNKILCLFCYEKLKIDEKTQFEEITYHSSKRYNITYLQSNCSKCNKYIDESIKIANRRKLKTYYYMFDKQLFSIFAYSLIEAKNIQREKLNLRKIPKYNKIWIVK